MIYMASKTQHADKWRALRQGGVPISSTWIDEAGPGETQDFSDLWCRCISESANAECVIVYAEEGDVLKGAFVEVGSALASKKPVLAVGLPSNLSVLSHPLVEVMPNMLAAVNRAMGICDAKRGKQ